MRKHSLYNFSDRIRLLVSGWSKRCSFCRLIGQLLRPGRDGVASPKLKRRRRSLENKRLEAVFPRSHHYVLLFLLSNSLFPVINICKIGKGKATGLISVDGQFFYSLICDKHISTFLCFQKTGVGNPTEHTDYMH